MRSYDDDEYTARVWMSGALKKVLEEEIDARLQAFLPLGCHLTTRLDAESGEYTAQYGEFFTNKPSRTPLGAKLRLLAVMVESGYHPGCCTAQLARNIHEERVAEAEAERDRLKEALESALRQ